MSVGLLFRVQLTLWWLYDFDLGFQPISQWMNWKRPLGIILSDSPLEHQQLRSHLFMLLIAYSKWHFNFIAILFILKPAIEGYKTELASFL